MKVLLDTQIAIWALNEPRRLGAQAAQIIADERNDIYVSVVTIWEIAIKFALAKRRGAPPFSGAVALRLFAAAGYRLLDVKPEHAVAVESLPPLHADPFDRMLIAQALSEPLRLITADAAVTAYGDAIFAI